jgi:hypothetical protein
VNSFEGHRLAISSPRLILWGSHNVNMCPRCASPHDVCASGLVSCRQPCGLRIKRPQNHPVRSNGDRRARLIRPVGVTPLCRHSQHVFDARDGSTGLRFVMFKVAMPLHRDFVSAHRRHANSGRIAGHAGKVICPLIPSESISATVASFVMLEGPADSARLIFSVSDSCGVGL